MNHYYHNDNNVEKFICKKAIINLKELAERTSLRIFKTHATYASMPPNPMAVQALDDK